MNLLAFDTSTEFLSIALLRGQSRSSLDVAVGQAHSQLLLPKIHDLLADAGMRLQDLQGIAFGAGPGSFTGVRIAAGVAQGLAFGAQLPVVGICTLLALAEASGAEKVIACLDARMGEVYYAAYERVAGVWQTVHAPSLFKPEAVPSVTGPDWVGAGSGWHTYATVLTAIYAPHLLQIQGALLPTADAILTLAQPIFASGQAGSALDALPIYIRNRVAFKTVERAQGLHL